jgi:SAM-dependent methyltransferase
MLASDRELPVSGGPEKRAYVRDVFTAIAPTYDRLNRIISLRFDQGWRRYAVGRLGWERRPDGIYLDLCAGTLDFAATLARQPGFRGRIVAADFVPAMLRLGRDKAAGLAPVTADALELPFPDASFDAAVSSLALHYLPWRETRGAFAEIRRVLRPGSPFLFRVNATDDYFHGAGQGEQLEPNFYSQPGAYHAGTKRFFDEDMVRAALAGLFEITHLEHKTIYRFQDPKAVWECLAFAI